MPEEPHYSEQFKYTRRMLEKIEKAPLLAALLVQETTFKDFQTTLKTYEEDIKNRPADAG